MARVRITKAQKELRDKKASALGYLRGISSEISGYAFLFPEVHAEARAAQDALVALADRIGKIGVEP